MKEDATRWRAGIDGVSQAVEMHASFVKFCDQVDQVLRAATESIQLPHDQRVTFTQVLHCFGEPWAFYATVAKSVELRRRVQV